MPKKIEAKRKERRQKEGRKAYRKKTKKFCKQIILLIPGYYLVYNLIDKIPWDRVKSLGIIIGNEVS